MNLQLEIDDFKIFKLVSIIIICISLNIIIEEVIQNKCYVNE